VGAKLGLHSPRVVWKGCGGFDRWSQDGVDMGANTGFRAGAGGVLGGEERGGLCAQGEGGGRNAGARLGCGGRFEGGDGIVFLCGF